MAYAADTDIQAEFKSITFSGNASVSTADVTEFISQEEAALNAAVSTVYATPITSTNGVKIMKLMTTLMVKARIMDILPVKTGNADVEQGNPADALRERVGDMLKRILNKTLLLADATLSETSGGVKDYNSSNDIEQKWQRDVDQW